MNESQSNKELNEYYDTLNPITTTYTRAPNAENGFLGSHFYH